MLQDDWKAQLAMWREDKRERQRARERKQKLPPNPHHNPRGWMEWKQTHDFLDLQGRELWR